MGFLGRIQEIRSGPERRDYDCDAHQPGNPDDKSKAATYDKIDGF